MDMIEQVERAVYASLKVEGFSHQDFDLLNTFQKTQVNKMARAALSAMPRHVPEGWVLMPKEPTKEMIKSGSDAALVVHRTLNTGDVYRAMLSAARPPAPLSEASDKPVNTQLEK